VKSADHKDLAKQQQAMALSEVMSPAADWYKQQLKQNTRAIDYLKGRGLSGEIAKRFNLGYAPEAWQGLEACVWFLHSRLDCQCFWLKPA